MSPPNFHFIKYLKQLLLATSLVALTACGGGGGDDDDDDTPPVATNKNPTVSISSDSSVTEGGELVLQATATDSDGEIASYAWQQTSGPELTLSGSDTSKLTITAPEIEEDAIVVVSLIVTDDDAATATAKVSIELKRKVLSLKITGIVTDEPIINSNVAVQIGDQQFEVTADAEGRYSVNIEVDDSDADELVKLVALGNNAIDPDVEFISQLKSIATLISQAGSDGTLSKDENFGVNITNVSTAEFALLSRNGADIDSEQALDKALLAVDADEKLLLAAIIKIIVDDPNFSLPEGINSTLQLVTSQQETANFVNHVNYSNAKLIEDTKTAIKRDTDLVDNSFSSVVGSHLIVSPKYYTKHSASQIEFYTDGTGRYIDTSFDVVFSWTQQDGVVNTILSEPKKGSCYLESNGGTQQRMCRYITDLKMQILSENDASKTVEVFTNVEIRNEVTAEVFSTEQLTNNRTLIDKLKALPMSEGEITGSWYADNTSYFSGYSNVVNFNLVEGGVGNITNNDGTYTPISWSVDGNQLLISGTDESMDLNYSFWFIKAVNAGYQFVASLKSADDARVTSTGLFIRDHTLFLNKSDVLGKWVIYQGVNAVQTDLHYDVYDDGLMDFNLNRAYRTWHITNNGVFVRNTYYTEDGGVSGECDKVDNSCPIYSQYTQQLLAKDGEHFYTYRQSHIFDIDGTENPEAYSSHIREFSVSDNYGVSHFAPYWWENIYASDDTGYRYFTNLYTFKENELETIELATIFTNSTNAFEYSIATTHLGVYTQNSYSLQNGKLVSDEWVYEVIGTEREFLTICVYRQGNSCTEDAKQQWYFDKSKVIEQIELLRPLPDNPLDGAWQLSSDPYVTVIFKGNKWIHLQTMHDLDEEGGQPGYEIGIFTWDEATGKLSVAISEDTNGTFGFDSQVNNVVSVEGDNLTLEVEGEEALNFTRIYSPTNPLIGGYSYGSHEGDFFIKVIKEDGIFLELAHDSENGEMGISGGSYSFNDDTQKFSIKYYIKTYGSSIEDADSNIIVKSQGNFLHFKDGDDFGLFERITRVIEQQAFAESDLLGSHQFVFTEGEGTSIQTSKIVIANDGTASFEIDGTIYTATWELDLGSLRMFSVANNNQRYGYGLLMTPVKTVMGGYSVETLSFIVPSNYDDDDDPALHRFLSGSLIKQ